MNMRNGLSLGLLIVGVLLIIWGINASESLSSEVSRAFTGSPTDRTIWLLASGIILTLVGSSGLLYGRLRK